jgi:transcriptional regulator with XRE-family HTH domain
MDTLADILKKLRKSNNLTQAELGKILGVGKTTISMYETGNSTPSDEIKLKIAEHFNISLDFLLGNSNIILIDQPELSLHQKVALKFADQLTKDGYELEENDLNDLLLVSKFTLEQKKNKK